MEHIANILLALPGIAALYLAVAQRRNEEAEESEKLTKIAMDFVEPLQERISELERKIQLERALRKDSEIRYAQQGRVLTVAIKYINDLTTIMSENGLRMPQRPTEIESWLRQQTNVGKGDGD